MEKPPLPDANPKPRTSFLHSQTVKAGLILFCLLAVGFGLSLFMKWRSDKGAPSVFSSSQALDREAQKPPETVRVVNLWANDPKRTPDGGYLPEPIFRR